MLITNGMIVTPGVRRRTIERQVNLGPMSLRIVSIVIIAAAALMVLAQSTQLATKKYKEEQLKNDLVASQKEVDEMQTEATRLQALNAILPPASPSPSPSAAPLESPKQINFLPAGSTSNISQLPSNQLAQ